MAEMVQGQLYRVGLTGRGDGESTEIELIFVALNAEDAKTRLPWCYDMSDFSSYRVDFVEKIHSRSHVIKTKIVATPACSPDAVIQRESQSQGVWQSVGTPGRLWQVAAMADLYAKDEKHAIKKLKERIGSGSERVKVIATEKASPSGFAVAKDQSMFDKATFVRG